MAKKTLVHLGFMANKLQADDVLQRCATALELISKHREAQEVESKVMVVLSGESARLANPANFDGLRCRKELVLINPRTTVSGERHRLFAAGFLESASFTFVCDLDYGHTSEVIAQVVTETLEAPALVVLPQSNRPRELARDPWTLSELVYAFEDILVLEAAGRKVNDRFGEPGTSFQNGLWLFESRAVRELLRRQWVWECTLWDVQAAFFCLASETLSIKYPRVALGTNRPEFSPKETIRKTEVLRAVSGRLGGGALKEKFEEFSRHYAHRISASVSDKFREAVLSKV